MKHKKIGTSILAILISTCCIFTQPVFANEIALISADETDQNINNGEVEAKDSLTNLNDDNLDEDTTEDINTTSDGIDL